MARLVRLLEQHLNRQPPTVVTQAITWWETVLSLVKLQEIGLGVNLPVEVCYYTLCTCGPFMSIQRFLLRPFLDHGASRLLNDRLQNVWKSTYFSCLLCHTVPWSWLPNHMSYSLPMRLAELIVHLKNEKSCLSFNMWHVTSQHVLCVLVSLSWGPLSDGTNWWCQASKKISGLVETWLT